MAMNRDKILKGAEKFVQKGKIDNAIREYEKLLKLNPNDVNTINRVGDLYNRIGQVDRAVELYERIANAFAADGFASKAIAIFKKINRLAPDRVEIFERLADLYIQQGLVIEARSQFQVLADWFLKNDDVENGIQTMRKLVQVDPENHMAHLRLADLLFRRGDSDEAIGVYQRLGSMLLGRGKVDEAERLYRHALEQDPPSGEFFAPMCEALVDSGNVATAREFLIEAQKRSPESVQLRIIGLRVALATGDTQEAIELAEGALAEAVNHPDVPGLAGRAFLAGGESEKGKGILVPAARVMLERGDEAAARGVFHELFKALPEDREVLSLGITALSSADDQEMVLTLRAALADSYYQAGEKDQARRIYLDLKRQDPENGLFAQRLAELGEQGEDGAPHPAATEESEPDEDAPVQEPGEEVVVDEIVDEESEIIEFDIPELPAEEVSFSPEEQAPAQVESTDPTGSADPGFLPEERLAEANVFAKYGLLDKAISHLESILEVFPNDQGAREKIVQLAMDAGRAEYAAEQAAPLFEAYRAAGDDHAIASLVKLVPEVASGPVAEPGAIADVDAAEPAAEHTPEEASFDHGVHDGEFRDSGDEVEFVAPDDLIEDIPGDGPESGFEASAEAGSTVEEPDQVTFDEEIGHDGEQTGFQVPSEEVDWDPDAEPSDGSDEIESIEFEKVELEPRKMPAMAPGNGLEFEAVAISDFEVDGPDESALQGGAGGESAFSRDDDELALDAPIEPEIIAEAGSRFEEEVLEEPPSKPRAPKVVGAGILGELEELERTLSGPGRAPVSPAAPVADAGETILEKSEAESDDFPERSPRPPSSELEQLDSFIENSLYEDAARILMRLEGDFPDDAAVSQRRAALKSKGFLMDAVAAPMEDAEDLFADEADEYVDLAAELEEEMAAEEAMVEEAVGSQDGEAELEEVFREFQKGVAEQLSEEDSDTHFNLGIAYKEMGLLPEAIREFQISSRDPGYFVECCSMIGVCYVEQGLWEQGAEWYEKALSSPNLTLESQTALKYDLANALEGAGDVERAMDLFREVSTANPSFRDVSVRLSDLGGEQYAN